MSTSSIAYEAGRSSLLGRLADYGQLIRPKIALLELVTLAVGAVVASAGMPAEPWLLAHAMVGTTLLAASASILNQWLERGSDALMERTASRPLPAGRLSGAHVFVLGSLTGIAGMAYLVLVVNLNTTLLGFASWFLYIAAYTPLKFRTTANTMVGAVSGAIPVLMGWAAVGGSFHGPYGVLAAMLFVIVYLWQFPHFMAIAWLYRDDYRAAGIQVTPVVEPTGRRAAVQAISLSLCLIPVTLVPIAICWKAFGNLPAWTVPYGLGAIFLGVMQVVAAVRFGMLRDELSARRLLHATLVYLPAILGLLVVAAIVLLRGL